MTNADLVNEHAEYVVGLNHVPIPEIGRVAREREVCVQPTLAPRLFSEEVDEVTPRPRHSGREAYIGGTSSWTARADTVLRRRAEMPGLALLNDDVGHAPVLAAQSRTLQIHAVVPILLVDPNSHRSGVPVEGAAPGGGCSANSSRLPVCRRTA